MLYFIVLLLGLHSVSAAPPLKLTIDCSSQETDYPGNYRRKFAGIHNQIDVDSLCSIIHKTLPKSVNDGKFILIGEPADQSRASNDQAPITIPPPKGFRKPRIKIPKLNVPKLKVPHLKSTGPLAPRVGAPMHFPERRGHLFPTLRAREREDESSAERMEKFKKGVQKMLHVVKVLGQIDQYVSERTRIIVDILSKTFTDQESPPKHIY